MVPWACQSLGSACSEPPASADLLGSLEECSSQLNVTMSPRMFCRGDSSATLLTKGAD